LGHRFPAKGVGVNWTSRFIKKHSDRLKMFWTHNLEMKRGQAVNPATNKEWFDLLESVLNGERDYKFDEPPPPSDSDGDSDDEDPDMPRLSHVSELNQALAGDEGYVDDEADDEDRPNFVPILEENIYGTDESGFFPEGGVRVRVIGARGKKTQHQQSDGGRENTTVIVTICADGSSIKPVVIYKGKHFQVKWDQDNPTEAS
jgi:hypothetical protein